MYVSCSHGLWSMQANSKYISEQQSKQELKTFPNSSVKSLKNAQQETNSYSYNYNYVSFGSRRKLIISAIFKLENRL